MIATGLAVAPSRRPLNIRPMAVKPNDSLELKVLGQALRNLRKRADMSQAQAAEAMGFESGEAWRKYEAGLAIGIFRPDMQTALAQAVNSSPEELQAERNRVLRPGSAPQPNSGRASVTVVTLPGALPAEDDRLAVRDRVQAGAWLAADDTIQTSRTYPALRDERYPYAKQWLSEVSGDSVDKLGIFNGDLVHCIDAIDLHYQPRTGDVVEVERLRFEGRERELSIKQVEVYPDGSVKLWPRSTNPRWTEPLDLTMDVGEETAEVRIRALVTASIRRFTPY